MTRKALHTNQRTSYKYALALFTFDITPNQIALWKYIEEKYRLSEGIISSTWNNETYVIMEFEHPELPQFIHLEYNNIKGTIYIIQDEETYEKFKNQAQNEGYNTSFKTIYIDNEKLTLIQ